MSFKCKIGLHSWKGCKCFECGKIRDKKHDWTHDCNKCLVCGKKLKSQHEWNGCTCSLCGQNRGYSHDWLKDCEKCSICGEIRANQHDWSKNCEKCSKCGKISGEQHVWDGCKCETCDATRDEQHDWLKVFRCYKCGKKISEELFDCEDEERTKHFERILSRISVYDKSDIYPGEVRWNLDELIIRLLPKYKSLFHSNYSDTDGYANLEINFTKYKVEMRRSFSTSFGYCSIKAVYVYRVETDKYILVDYYNDSTT